MKLVAALLVLSIMPTQAEICMSSGGSLRPCDYNDSKMLPPTIYDMAFAGSLIETIALNMEQMNALCAPYRGLLGCSQLFPASNSAKARCYIYLAPEDYLRRFAVTRDAMRRHEIAHCNGWPAEHPK